jgi:hypothetical protein
MPKTRADYSFRYYALLGDPPTYDGPAPLEAAARYLERVQEALRLNGRRLPDDVERYGGIAGAVLEWTRDERRNLLRLRDRWMRRAAGEDRRWLTRGERPGPAPSVPHPDFARPLGPGEQPPPTRGHH